MTDAELRDALDGLFAYDDGCIGSGIHDEALRQRVIAELCKDLKDGQLYGDRVTRLAREMWLSDEAIAAGYGLEDLRAFVDWLDDRMRPS